MNEYTRGALEALFWALMVLKKQRSSEAGKEQIRGAVTSLIKKAATSFQDGI